MILTTPSYILCGGVMENILESTYVSLPGDMPIIQIYMGEG